MLLFFIGSISIHYLKEVSEFIHDRSEGNLRWQLFRLSSLRRHLLLLLTTLFIVFWLLRLHLPSDHRGIGITAMLTVLHFIWAPGIRTQVFMLTRPVLPQTELFPQPSSMSSTGRSVPASLANSLLFFLLFLPPSFLPSFSFTFSYIQWFTLFDFSILRPSDLYHLGI